MVGTELATNNYSVAVDQDALALLPVLSPFTFVDLVAFLEPDSSEAISLAFCVLSAEDQTSDEIDHSAISIFPVVFPTTLIGVAIYVDNPALTLLHEGLVLAIVDVSRFMQKLTDGRAHVL